jgi:soluble lytic murein transglycosylase
MSRGRSAVLALALAGSLVAGAGPPAQGAVVVAPSGLARYAEAHAALAGGEYARARGLFETLPPGFLLADYAEYYAAEALLRAGDEAGALARFHAYPDRHPDALLASAAMLAAADTAFRLGRWADAEREARRFLSRAPGHGETGRILVRLAEARAAQGQVTEALADLRRRWVEAPASAWGEAARETLEALAAEQGAVLPPLTAEETLLQAERLAEAGEQTAAVRLLEGLLAPEFDPDIRHRALARMAPLLARLARGSEAIGRLEAALREPPTAARPALLYELGRLLQRTGPAQGAVPVFERLLAEHPAAAAVPDGWLQLARTRRELGEVDEARAAFRALVAAHPDSAAAAAARWELAWLEYRAGRFRDAALVFRQLSATVSGFRLAGLYWSARALDQVGERTAAGALYREVVSRGPNGYYGILAARRLRGPAPAPLARAVKLASDPVRLLRGERGYQKAQALASIGFDEFARAELEVLGREAAADGDRAWALGIAFAELGEPGRSLRHLRRGFGAAVEGGAPGLPLRFWRMYYPLGYEDVVRAAARTAGLDPYFVAAVIREESSYDPRARSWVGAIGLMQLMPDTARLVAREAGRPLDEIAAVWDPATNIALGTRYLAQLRSRFQEPLLAVAGYNAGPHRVQRWLAERPKLDLEEFVDQIPFEETRAFAKRVFTSWHHYRRLYEPPPAPARRGEAEAAPRPAR